VLYINYQYFEYNPVQETLKMSTIGCVILPQT